MQLKAELRYEIAISEGDMSRVHSVCARLAAAQPAERHVDVSTALVGDWRTLTSSVAIANRPTVPLKFLTFGALPPTPVVVDSWFNRVRDGTYTLVPVVRHSDEAPLVGIAISGPCGFEDAAKLSVCEVRFETVQLVPTLGADGQPSVDSLAACSELGGEAAASHPTSRSRCRGAWRLQ
jgi:hypothetical protein